jgi:hypothetical protein
MATPGTSPTPAQSAQPAGSPALGGNAPSPPAASEAHSSAKVTASTAPYVTRPTRWTIFLRTFVPWQLWRFARINAKMIKIIRGRHT